MASLQLQPDILERNLSALRIRQPEVANALAECAIPEGVAAAQGRDGEPTLLLQGAGGPAWLGGSSMPRASSEEMFGNIRLEGGSVSLPAMMSGMEALMVARRLSAPFAVFVIDSPAGIKLPLMIRDFVGLLRDGRIVFLLSDDLPNRMRQFFEANPGYCTPSHLFQVPQVPPGKLANLTRELESASSDVVRIQSERVVASAAGIRARIQRTTGNRPLRAVILASQYSVDADEWVRRLERGLGSFDSTCSSCLPTNPAQSHVAARMHCAAQSGADFALYLDGVSHHERSAFPADFPVVDWLRQDRAPALRSAWGPRDLAIVECVSTLARVRDTGWPPAQALLLEPSTCIPNNPSEGFAEADAEHPIRVLMNLPDDRPEAAAITLPSQIELWRAMQKEMVRRADKFSMEDAAAALKSAQDSIRTNLADAELIRIFEEWLRRRIAPASIGRSVGLALVKGGLRAEVWGHNWPEMGRGGDIRRGPIPSADRLYDLLRSSSCVVLPWDSHAAVELAVESLAHGNFVFMRGRQQDFSEQYPGLAEISGAIQWFRATGDLITMLRNVMKDGDRHSERARSTARLIRERHSICARYELLREALRQSRSRAPREAGN